jgi:hypothetical protein
MPLKRKRRNRKFEWINGHFSIKKNI